MGPLLLAHAGTTAANLLRAGVYVYFIRREMSRGTKPDESITYQSDEDSGAVLGTALDTYLGHEESEHISYRGYHYDPNTLNYVKSG